MTMKQEAEAWRLLYLQALRVQLALVEYIAKPDADMAGVSLILSGTDLSQEA